MIEIGKIVVLIPKKIKERNMLKDNWWVPDTIEGVVTKIGQKYFEVKPCNDNAIQFELVSNKQKDIKGSKKYTLYQSWEDYIQITACANKNKKSPAKRGR